jgi:hypothetical protein
VNPPLKKKESEIDEQEKGKQENSLDDTISDFMKSETGSDGHSPKKPSLPQQNPLDEESDTEKEKETSPKKPVEQPSEEDLENLYNPTQKPAPKNVIENFESDEEKGKDIEEEEPEKEKENLIPHYEKNLVAVTHGEIGE